MEPTIPNRLRAADADRERVANLVQAAGTEGRLTLEEIEDRLSAVYATKYTDELKALTADLPPEPAPRPGRSVPPRALRIHAAIVAVLAVLIIARWVASGAEFFWPIAPIFWLAMSVGVHARIRGARYRRAAVMS